MLDGPCKWVVWLSPCLASDIPEAQEQQDLTGVGGLKRGREPSGSPRKLRHLGPSCLSRATGLKSGQEGQTRQQGKGAVLRCSSRFFLRYF